jgi:hypothetical protein
MARRLGDEEERRLGAGLEVRGEPRPKEHGSSSVAVEVEGRADAGVDETLDETRDHDPYSDRRRSTCE